MNKKKILILLVVVVVILLSIILLFSKNVYTIEVEKIDSFSPDRRLIVYKNNKEIKFDEIKYTDETYLCSDKNPTVSYSEIMNEEELIIIINEKKHVIAKIVEK